MKLSKMSVGFRKAFEVDRNLHFGVAKQAAAQRRAYLPLSICGQLMICERLCPMPFDPGSNTVVDPNSARVHGLLTTAFSGPCWPSIPNYPKPKLMKLM